MAVFRIDANKLCVGL